MKLPLRYKFYYSVFKITMVIVVSISLVMPVVLGLTDRITFGNFLNNSTGMLVVFSLTSTLNLSIIFVGNTVAARYMPVWAKNIVELLVVLLLSALCLHLLYPVVTLKEDAARSVYHYRTYMSLNLLGISFVYIFQKGLLLTQKLRQKTVEAEKLQRDFAQYRLQALKNQVNPHFLFNSLSVLSSLVHKDKDLAESFVLRLSEAYTYILNQKDAKLVSLNEELKFLKAYFFLLQIRFKHKIGLEMNLQETQHFFVPPLVLQLLVENVVKHNQMSDSDPLIIHITQTENYLTIENPVKRRKNREVSTGLGLENIRNRYTMLGNNDVSVKEVNNTFTVTIPLIKK